MPPTCPPGREQPELPLSSQLLGAGRLWLSITCFATADPGFDRPRLIANPMSELVIELFGAQRGAHARTSPGVVGLPFDLPVILAAELAVD